MKKNQLWTNEKLSYLAAILDQSTFCISKNIKKAGIQLNFNSSQEKVMEWLVENFGGNYSKLPRSQSRKGQSVFETFRWRVNGKKLSDILYFSHIYQIGKKEHSIIVLDFIRTLTIDRLPVDEDVLLQRKELQEKLSSLNKKKELS